MEETNAYAQRIEEKLNEEIIKRKEADAALDKLAQTRLDTVQDTLIHQMQTNFRELKADIEAAKERLGETENKLVEVREKNERDLKACKLELVERLDRIQAGIRAEGKTRRGERPTPHPESTRIQGTHRQFSLPTSQTFNPSLFSTLLV